MSRYLGNGFDHGRKLTGGVALSSASLIVAVVVVFKPSILPAYARRSRSLEVLMPILYLKGIATGDFEAALSALLGKDALGLSASTIARLKDVWIDEHTHWKRRDFSAQRNAYLWADGIQLEARLEDEKWTNGAEGKRRSYPEVYPLWQRFQLGLLTADKFNI